MFVKTEVIQFKGYNSNVAPELIDNGEARDIYNFRMEKIGKMVSRNGYYVGLFADACQLNLALPTPFCDLNPGEDGYAEGLAYKAEILKRKNAYINNKGIVGIGELILSSHWNAIDTDRLMVYFLRFGTNDSFDVNYKPEYKNEVDLLQSQQSYGGFIFSPITGMHKNKLLYGNMPEVFVNATVQMANEDLTYEFYDDNKIPNINTFENRYRDPQYRKFEEQLYAPNKNTNKDDAWIDQYQDLSQYRHKLVVSDRINGDMLIQDEYSEEYDPEQDNRHKIVVRPNALETFDVNIVEVDFRTNADEENGTGIRQGMGLYNYELPKKQQKTSIDNIDGDYTLSDENWLGWGTAVEAGNQLSEQLLKSMLTTAFYKSVRMFDSVDAKLKYYGLYGKNDDEDPEGQIINYNRRFEFNNELFYRFTNADEETEFYDALGKAQLVEEEYVNDKGEKVVERPADVYIWEDYQIDYFISSGKQLGRIFLTDLDKEFTKATAGFTRIFELKELDEYGRTVPLGMWRYRFVWDFGNGVYSAPSAEMLVPDMLWSAIQDNELQQDQGFQLVDYQRPRKIGDNYTINNVEANEFWDTYVPDDHAYYATGTTFHKLASPPLIKNVSGTYSFSTLGSRLYDIKDILYKDTGHRFGVTGDKAINEAEYIKAIINPSDLLARKALGDFSTMLTVFFSKSDVITKGMIYEGVEIGILAQIPFATTEFSDIFYRPCDMEDIYGYVNSEGDYMRPRVGSPGVYLMPHSSNLIVPIFKSNNQQYTYNSIFDDEGRLRLVYSEGQGGGLNPDYLLKKQLVFPGTYPMIGTNNLSMFLLQPFLDPAVRGVPHNRLVGCPPLVHYMKHSRHQSDDIYLNFISYGKYGTELYFDKNNADKNDTTWSDLSVPLARPYNLMRAVKLEKDRLTNVVSDVDSEALKRLLLKDALVELYVAQPYDKIYFASEVWSWSNIPSDIQNLDADTQEDTVFDFDTQRTMNEVAVSMSGATKRDDALNHIFNGSRYNSTTDAREHYTVNTEVIVYGEAERLIAVEQLTSYFPSSLIHGSPRVTFKIHDDNIPPNAKNLLIFRTKNALDNSYQPTQYGLVDKVPINRMTRTLKESDDRDENGNPLGNSQQKYYRIEIGDAFTEKLFNGAVDPENRPEDVIEYLYHGIQYFDKITDSKLDFSFNPDNYDGFRKALWSRFNANMYERNYYANFYEEYNPLPPMGKEDVLSMPIDDPMTSGKWEMINEEWVYLEPGDINND